ncbi:MAG: glycine cleavage system protein T [Acidimicrobiia bacterium]|nr:glycine cleavage system protein T [Acidimicrobiia bacterium]
MELVETSRIMWTPFHESTLAAGVTAVTVYNHTMLPLSYGDPEAEYRRLTEGVAIWDVACQRQVQLAGPDAGDLAQILCTRDLSQARVGQGKYTAMVDHQGRLINDPLVLRADDDVWWLSLADGDMLQWCRAIASERQMSVEVSDANVAPLAVQGPLAEDVVAALLGDWIREIKFFNYHRAEVDGIPMRVGRAGWSKQGGFELYLEDATRGNDLWDLVMAAGEPFEIGPGGPNAIERVQSGLLSYRTETTDDTDPFEAGLGKYVDLEASDFIGRDALIEKRERGLQRSLVGVVFDEHPGVLKNPWPVMATGQVVGSVRVVVVSPKVGRSIGMAMIDVPHNVPGTDLVTSSPNGEWSITVAALPFV